MEKNSASQTCGVVEMCLLEKFREANNCPSKTESHRKHKQVTGDELAMDELKKWFGYFGISRQ